MSCRPPSPSDSRLITAFFLVSPLHGHALDLLSFHPSDYSFDSFEFSKIESFLPLEQTAHDPSQEHQEHSSFPLAECRVKIQAFHCPFNSQLSLFPNAGRFSLLGSTMTRPPFPFFIEKCLAPICAVSPPASPSRV